MLSLITNSTACRRTERAGLPTMASLTLSTFSVVRAVATGPGGFVFIIVPLVQKDVTHLKIVLRLGMFPCCPILKRQRKSHWVSIINSPLFTKPSYANKRCSNVHCGMTALKWYGLMSLIAPYPSLYPFCLLHNIHFKNIRFPWCALYFVILYFHCDHRGNK